MKFYNVAQGLVEKLKHENRVKIYYSDTDSYGIVWHGAYVKWFEMGRVELINILGMDFNEFDALDIVLPVVELNIRYKASSKIFDEVLIKTEIEELKPSSLTFKHTLINLTTNKPSVIATSTVVATSKDGKMYRKMPDVIYNKLLSALERDELLNV